MLHINRRKALIGVTSTMLGLAHAQSPGYPDRPVKVVVPVPPGGPTDQAGRLMTRGFQEALGAPFVIDNRAGAGGKIGADAVIRSPADGYTLLLSTNGTMTYIPAVEPGSAFDPSRDLTPISQIASYGMLLAVHPSVPARTIPEFIAYAKSHPGKLLYASSGQASGLHFAGEVFKSMAGVDMTHVAYKGFVPALQDVIGNVCQVIFAPGEAIAQAEAGRIRILGATTLERDPRLPSVPTISEAGLSGYDLGAWIALYGPPRLPSEVRDRLHGSVQKMLAAPEVRKQFASLGMNVIGGSPQQLEAVMRSETAKLRDVANRLGIKAAI